MGTHCSGYWLLWGTNNISKISINSQMKPSALSTSFVHNIHRNPCWNQVSRQILYHAFIFDFRRWIMSLYCNMVIKMQIWYLLKTTILLEFFHDRSAYRRFLVVRHISAATCIKIRFNIYDGNQPIFIYMSNYTRYIAIQIYLLHKFIFKALRVGVSNSNKCNRHPTEAFLVRSFAKEL